jgi:hypothetical protein
MLSAVLLLSLMTGVAAPSEFLVAIDADYRDVGAQTWVAQVDVMHVGTDYLIVRLDDGKLGELPPSTILDRGDLDARHYLDVQLITAAGRVAAERLGTVIFERGEHLIIRQEGEVPADFRMDGIRNIIPLRRLALPPAAATRPISETDVTTRDYVGDIVDAITDANYQATIQDLENFVSRNARTTSYYDACTYAHNVFESYGINAEIEEFLALPWYGEIFDCWNVVAEKTGLVYPEQIYIICGHLDSTAGNPSSPETVAPGADDNGSGSSSVLEAARVMANYEFEYTVRFVCFGAEEQGLCGSNVYAAEAAAAGEDILGVINLDMLLYGPPGHDRIKIKYNSPSEFLAQTFQSAAAAHVPDLDVDLIYDPGAGGSDHYSFWQNGYAAIEGIEENLSGNPYYHQVTDQLANYMGYFPFGTNCIRGGIATLATLAVPEGGTAIGEPGAGSPGVAADGLTITAISPNPVHSRALVSISTARGGTLELTLFDVRGRAHHRRQVEASVAGPFGVELALPDLPSGVYMVQVAGVAGTATRKIIVLR